MEIPKDINEFDPNSIPRCELCNLIPLININYEQNIPMISYECQNKHKNTLNLSEYLKVNKKILSLKKNTMNVKKPMITHIFVQNVINFYVRNVPTSIVIKITIC